MEEKIMKNEKKIIPVRPVRDLFERYVVSGDHGESDYLSLIKKLVAEKTDKKSSWQEGIDLAYDLLFREIRENRNQPTEAIKFGTSGWRGRLGKDVFAHSVCCVTAAIVELFQAVEREKELVEFLGVASFDEARSRGCVVGFDNRFAGEYLAGCVMHILAGAGFKIHYAGESTTGVLSAAVLECGAAFSINLTPSHNPLEYGGYKFNGADAGPAAPQLTERITTYSNRIIKNGESPFYRTGDDVDFSEVPDQVSEIDSLGLWKRLVRRNSMIHGLDLEKSVSEFLRRKDMVIAVDCVHGASRLHIRELFDNSTSRSLIILREEKDVTFGGVAPEPSSANMQGVFDLLRSRKESFRLGCIIDPDGDRIRFTDGKVEISMNQFGAMAYHFLHEFKGKRGIVAKTVATSNFANQIAAALGEEVFEPAVGFKNFKPVIGKALVCFEESDGISIIGHTPEKDAYIGLLLALEMMLVTGKNLGDYLHDMESEYGSYFPARDGIAVSVKGEELNSLLMGLEKYDRGVTVSVGDCAREIVDVITIDGRKMIFDDGSWLMIRPSGTEPKVRFYVESRTDSGTADLVRTAGKMLEEIGIL
jgi:phosphomannomutase